MKFNERIKKESLTNNLSNFGILDFAKNLFERFSEGYVVAGYEKSSHQKFLMMNGSGSVYEDAFQSCKDPFFEWLALGKEKFSNEDIQQPVIAESFYATEVIKDLDTAVERFSSASDAFLMFGYCGNHRVFKSFATDPLKADAVMYLQAMAFDLWGRKEES